MKCNLRGKKNTNGIRYELQHTVCEIFFVFIIRLEQSHILLKGISGMNVETTLRIYYISHTNANKSIEYM